MSPILLGLAVMCWRARHRLVSRANPRSPRQRSERSGALRVRVSISRSHPPGDSLTGYGYEVTKIIAAADRLGDEDVAVLAAARPDTAAPVASWGLP
jgi:hypothetical protein